MKKILILLLLIIAQACTKTEDKVKNYVASGKELYQKGDYDKAKIEFKNAVQLDGKQADAYYHLALIEEKKQNWQGMYANLSQVVRLDPKNNEAFLKLGRLNLLAGRMDDTLKHADSVLANDPENPDALSLKGAVMVKKNQLNEAMAIADQILGKHPDHDDAISLKTVIYMAKQDIPSALATVENALKLKPQNLSMMLLRLQVHSQEKNNTAIENDYSSLIKLFPDKPEYTYALVKHYADNGQEEKAENTLQAVIDKNPDQLQPKLVLVDFQMQKKPEQAEHTIQSYLKQFPNEPDLYFRLAAINLKENKLTEAKQNLNKIVDIKGNEKEGLSAKVMLAKIALNEKDKDLAANLIKDVLTNDSRNLDAMILKARMDIQKGEFDEAITNLRVALRDFTNSEEAMVLLGQTYLKKNSRELAEETFRKVLEINPANFDALLPVVAGMIKNKDIIRAEQLLKKALDAKPNHAGALQALAQVRLMQKDWAGTQKVADLIATKPQGQGFSKFLSGKISEEQGLLKEALGQYKEALALSPGMPDAMRGIVGAFEALGQTKAAYAFLEDYINKHPEEAYPWLLKGQALAKEKRWDDALKTLAEASGKWPKQPDFYEAIASIHMANKQPDKALETVKRALDLMPDEPRLSILLASTYEQSGDYDNALSTYEALIAKSPNIDIAVNNLVSLLLDHFSTKENLERAVNLAKRFERADQPFYLDTYAWALVSNGKSEEALQNLREVVKRMPEVPVFRYHLGVAYSKSNSKGLAIDELQQALKLGEKEGEFLEKEDAEKLLKTLKENAPA